MKTISLIAAAFGAIALFGAFKYSRAGYETPDYRVIESDGPFEIRDYPSMSLVSTPMDDAGPERDGSFMRLFRYISGANEESQKISMTTPVFMRQEEGRRTMSFVVPKEVAERGAPEATNGEVRLETVPGGRFAAYRFSGSWDMQKFDEAAAKLNEWVRQRGLEPLGEPQVANYDPPFTPPFLRRNEVLIRLKGAGEGAPAETPRR